LGLVVELLWEPALSSFAVVLGSLLHCNMIRIIGTITPLASVFCCNAAY